MESMVLHYRGQQSIKRNIHIGNVGSGDLEILLKPTDNTDIDIHITTSIDNHQSIWESIFERYFDENTPAMTIIINDFGATPGVIGLRLSQAIEYAFLSQETLDEHTSYNAISLIELDARERVRHILDRGSFRELLSGIQHSSYSPWLIMQHIVPQSNDGCVVGKGSIDGYPAVVIGIEPQFQGGAIGEISGAKIAAALELALADNEKGIPTMAVLLLETGGVRLQEANLGLAAIAEIHAAIVALRQYAPVISIIAGTVGCFGGMSIAAGLSSSIIITQEGRLGLNGPQVIEQEVGIEEYNAQDRPLIWSLTGGKARVAAHFADYLAEDDVEHVRKCIQLAIKQNKTPIRCEQIDSFLSILTHIDTQQQACPALVQAAFYGEKEDD